MVNAALWCERSFLLQLELSVCVVFKLLGPVAPALSALVTPRGYTSTP